MEFSKQIDNYEIMGVRLTGWRNDQVLEVWPSEDSFSENSVKTPGADGLYISATSIEFGEESKPSDAGPIYLQALRFSLPANAERVEILSRFRAVRHIQLLLCGGRSVFISRNDVALNKPIEAKAGTDKKTLSLTYQHQSIFPYQIT